MKKLLLTFVLMMTTSAHAGTAVIYASGQSYPNSFGTGTVNFNDYNAASVTVRVVADAWGASQQGNEQGYSGAAEAWIGGRSNGMNVPNGADGMSVTAELTLTFTKGADGNWYEGGTNYGTSVSVMSFAWVSGNDAQGSANAFCEVTWVDAPPNRPPTIGWTSAPATAAHASGYFIGAAAHDDDGNLVAVEVWKNGVPFATGGGGSGYDSSSGNATSDSGPATVTYTARATDAAGAVSATITHGVTIDPPPPVNYTFETLAGAGGAAGGGGTFASGTWVTAWAVPNATYDFAGWSGDASGMANPVSVLIDRNKSVTALFVLKSYPVTTSAGSGGSVTPGGTYPYGSSVTITATPGPGYRFTGWTGDAAGTAPSVTVTVSGPLNVVANFAAKTPQAINFPSIANRTLPAPAFSGGAAATSGLPVTYSVVSGAATIVGGQIQVNGAGAITIRASQAGDEFFLAAPNVDRTFNAYAPAVVKLQPAARVIRANRREPSPNFILQP